MRRSRSGAVLVALLQVPQLFVVGSDWGFFFYYVGANLALAWTRSGWEIVFNFGAVHILDFERHDPLIMVNLVSFASLFVLLVWAKQRRSSSATTIESAFD